MEKNETENTEVVEETEEEVEETTVETEDPAELKARIKQLEEKAIAQRERTKILKQDMAKLKTQSEKLSEKKPEKVETKTGELDDTQLDYLDLKGISDSDEIEIIQKVMKNTGQTVRQALKDDYVQTKLTALRAKKAVADAMPSATKRGGTQLDGFDQAYAKFEATGELPSDFELRSKIVLAKEQKETTNKPGWR